MDRQAQSGDRFTSETLIDLAEAGLCWVETKDPALADFELRSGEAVVASLRFRDAAGFVAIGESAGGAWTLTDEGLVRPRVRLTSLDDQATLALYKSRLPGLAGTVQFFDGRRLCWRRFGFCATTYRFVDAEGRPVVAVRCQCSRSRLFGPRVTKGFVEIEPHAYGTMELILLLLLGWYLTVVQKNSVRFLICPSTTAGRPCGPGSP
jgi:hypothetical protein